MKLLTDDEINAYIASKEWVDCAGAYSIQGRAKTFFLLFQDVIQMLLVLPLPSLINVLKGYGFFLKNKMKKK